MNRKPRDWSKILTHVLLILSIMLIGFPLYFAFVISTQTMQDVIQAPQKLWPSSHLWENYTTIWGRVNMGRLLMNSSIVALTVSIGKIAISGPVYPGIDAR